MNTQHAEALQLRLERVIPATPERVFAAWTQPALLSKWSTPDDLTTGEGDLDLRVGGNWRVVMHAKNGITHEAFGTYREITPPSRLVYTHAWRNEGAGSGNSPETLLTVEFFAEPRGTRVVLTQVGFGTAASRDGHRGGWTSALTQLETLFAVKS